MRKMGITCFLLVAGAMSVMFVLPAHAQDDAESEVIYRIVTTDGNTFIGSLVSENDQEVVLQTDNVGQVTIQRSDIKTMEQVNPDMIKDGEYWHENPHSTRYLFSTSAIGLKQGEGYYQNTWIFFNNINYGVTDNFSLGGGFVPTFLFGTKSLPVWVIPKVSIPISTDKLYIAAGGLFGGVVGEESLGLGMAYGVGTVGNRDNNISVGLGYGYADGRWADIPLINVNGMYRFKKNMYLLSENYFVTANGETIGMISAALRWAPENFALDMGLIRPTDIGGEFIGIPWLGVAIPFGK